MPISDQNPYEKKYQTVHGKKMAYLEHGEGDPIVFLHGNPTSSYLWRNVMPHVEGKGRLIAPDLIGMGDSEKLDNSGPDSYTFIEQYKYLSALLELLGVNKNVTLVIHDWGTALGFHWAYSHADKVKGIAFMEGLFKPISSWDGDEFPEIVKANFQAIRSQEGEEMILKNNMFVEGVLQTLTMRKLTDVEMAEYRRPFLREGEDRRPTLTFPRQIPIAGEPAETAEIISNYSTWLSQCDIPKLFIIAEPGIMPDSVIGLVRTWPVLTEATVAGSHFVQEDSPDQLGEAIASWHAKLS